MIDRLNCYNEMNDSIWIRGDGPICTGRSCLAVFRLEFELPEKAEEAIIKVSAADRYRLYVNGVAAVSGPRKGDRYNHYYETMDIAPMLKNGFNSITARVVSYASKELSNSQWSPMSVYCHGVGPVFVLKGSVSAGGETIPLSTGKADWTAAEDSSYGLDNSHGWCVILTEKFYAESALNWRENMPMKLPKAKTAFSAAIEAHGEMPPIILRPRTIPNMTYEHGNFENISGRCNSLVFSSLNGGMAVIKAGQTAETVLDAGSLTTAYLRLASMGRGGRITLTYAERYFPNDGSASICEMRRDDYENGVIYGQFDEIYPSDCETVFENFWFRTFRFVRISVTAADEDVMIKCPDFISTGYPLSVKADLDFADPKMKKLWEMSVLTLKNCMHETYEDCPYYEQMQYPQDTRLQALFTYAISGDTRLAKNAIWDFHCSRLPNGLLQSRYPAGRETQVIPGFSLYWIYMLDEYVEESGDTNCIRTYLPTVDGILNYYSDHLNAQGLVEGLGYWEFGDWAKEWELGVPTAVRFGASALHNLNYSLALRTAARLAELCGRDGLAEEYASRSESVNNAVLHSCFDEKTGLIREGDGKDFCQYSCHTQALAVLCGALTGAKAKNALRRFLLCDETVKCSFPWHFTLLRAFEKAGVYDELAPIIWRQYYPLLDRGLTTMPEGQSHDRSDCHAWSAVPLYEYTRMVLGVKTIGPGCESIEVCPHPGELETMSGTVPTAKGPISVSWSRNRESGRFHIRLSAPQVPVKVIANGEVYHTDGGELEIF